MSAILHSPLSAPAMNGIVRRTLVKARDQAAATDQCLIKQVAGSDRLAMATLYRRYAVQVYRFAVRMTGNSALAEDIVSDVFLDVWRHADRFNAESKVSTWLLAITRNKSLTLLRRRRDESLDHCEVSQLEDAADASDAVLEKKDAGAVIRKCMLQLHPVQREVIELAYYHEKSIDEVAKITGASANTVKTRMFYARRRLRALLGSFGVNDARIH